MDSANMIQVLASLIFVISLIGLCAVAYRKLVMDKNLMQAGKTRRLKVEENLYLDAKRKLVLVKKDDQEILILVGANSETVIYPKIVVKKPRRKIAKS